MPPAALNLANAVNAPIEDGLHFTDVSEDADTHPVIADLTRLAINNDHFARRSRVRALSPLGLEKSPPPYRRWASEFPDLPEPRRAALTKLEDDDTDADRALYTQYILRELYLLRLAVPGQIPDLTQHLLSSSANPIHLASFVLELSALRLIATHPQFEACTIRVPHVFNGEQMEIDILAQMGGETVLAEVTTRRQKSTISPQMKRLFALTDTLDQIERTRLYCVFGIFGVAPFIPNWQAAPNALRPMTLVEFHRRLIADWGPYSIIDERKRAVITSVPNKILDRAKKEIPTATDGQVKYGYQEARKKIPYGQLRDNMAHTSCVMEAYFTATKGKLFWQKLASHLWQMIAACTTEAEALDILSLVDDWVSARNFAALEKFYRLTVLEPAQER